MNKQNRSHIEQKGFRRQARKKEKLGSLGEKGTQTDIERQARMMNFGQELNQK